MDPLFQPLRVFFDTYHLSETGMTFPVFLKNLQAWRSYIWWPWTSDTVFFMCGMLQSFGGLEDFLNFVAAQAQAAEVARSSS